MIINMTYSLLICLQYKLRIHVNECNHCIGLGYIVHIVLLYCNQSIITCDQAEIMKLTYLLILFTRCINSARFGS